MKWSPRQLLPGTARAGPPGPQVTLRRETFGSVLASTGTPPSLFDLDANATGQREAFRRYLTLTVQPLARLLAHELTMKLETPGSFSFDDLYAHDLIGRAGSFQRLVAGGIAVDKLMHDRGELWTYPGRATPVAAFLRDVAVDDESSPEHSVKGDTRGCLPS